MESYRQNLIVTGVVFLILNTAVVFARVYVRTIIRPGSFGLDDVTLCLTYLGFVLAYIFLFIAIYYGYAAEEERPWYDAGKLTQYEYANQTTLYISAGLVKLAVALVLFRIAVVKGIRWLLIGSMVIVGIWTVITVLFASWLCATSDQGRWVGDDTCAQVALFRTISNIFIDYFYALLPIYMLWGCQMKRKLKLLAMFLLGLGIVASTATIAKLIMIIRLWHATPPEAEGLHYDLALWADIELSLAIFAASAAALRPILQHIPTLFNIAPYYKLKDESRGSKSRDHYVDIV
ncbi:hypothetical protein F4859DRAFT_137909 [Xylaria cf. heliscus]|nr:hypothetical protein F4859DRAFT_137909 [Xylaria cf. heliscus]